MDAVRQITIPVPWGDALDTLAIALGITPEATAETILSMSLADGARRVRRELRIAKPRRGYTDLAALRAYHAEGLSIDEATLRLGVRKSTVSRNTRRAGAGPWVRRYKHPRLDEALAALHAGAITALDVAGRTGNSRESVLQSLYRLEEQGKVRRTGHASRLSPGRAMVAWRVVE